MLEVLTTSPLVEVLRDLADAGFADDLFVDEEDGSLRCGSCRASQPADEVKVESIRRLEGASDPGDLAVVIALRCPVCSTAGTAVLRYGPEASAGEAVLLRAFDDERPSGLDPGEQAAGNEESAR